MHYFTQVTSIRETDAGTDLIIHIPDEKLKHRLSKYARNGIADAEIRIDDGRTITNDQRRKIFATVGDIAYQTYNVAEHVREALLYKYCAKTGEMPFSLSNCSVTQAKEYMNFILEFAIEWGIPLSGPGADRTDEIDKYLYFCIKHRTCAITMRKEGVEIHHVTGSRVGMGRTRTELDHSKLELIALSKEWHDKVHTQGEIGIFKEKKIYGIKVDTATLKHIGIKTSEIT